jgi:hypothetical protein
MVSIDTLVSIGATTASSLEGFVATETRWRYFRRTDTKVQLRTHMESAHPRGMKCCQERTAMENEISRVVNAVPVLMWTVLPSRRGNTGTLQGVRRQSRQASLIDN